MAHAELIIINPSRACFAYSHCDSDSTLTGLRSDHSGMMSQGSALRTDNKDQVMLHKSQMALVSVFLIIMFHHLITVYFN